MRGLNRARHVLLAVSSVLCLGCPGVTDSGEEEEEEEITEYAKSISFPYSETWVIPHQSEGMGGGSCIANFNVAVDVSLKLKPTEGDPMLGTAEVSWTQSFVSASNPQVCKAIPSTGPTIAKGEVRGTPSQLDFQFQSGSTDRDGSTQSFSIGFSGSQSNNVITGTLRYGHSQTIAGPAGSSASGSTNVPITIPIK